MSGLSKQFIVRGACSELSASGIGSGLRHHITAEEVGRVLMSGSGHKLHYKQGTGGRPVEGIPQEKSLDSRGSFSEIKKI